MRARKVGTLSGIAMTVALAGCNPQAPRSAVHPATPAPRASGLPLRVTGQGTAHRPVVFVEKKRNRILFRLLASAFESIGPQGAQQAEFSRPRITFHDKKGATLQAIAPRAVLDQSKETITLLGGVNARTEGGMTLQCDRLVYTRSDEMLHGSGHVVVVDPKGFRGTGSSFQSDISLTHYRMQ